MTQTTETEAGAPEAPAAVAVEAAVPVVPLRSISPAEASRAHLDAIEVVQLVSPMLVALTVIIGYVALVWHGQPADGKLADAVPLIVAFFFLQHGQNATKRRG